MQGVALVQVEGVLSASHDAVGVPTFSGKMLTLALDKAGLQVLYTTDLETDRVAHWLELEMPSIDKIKLFSPKETEDPIRSARNLGYTVVFWVTADPGKATHAFESGVVPLFCPHPEYARPEFRPDARVEGPRPWDELLSVVEHRQEQRRHDMRMAKTQERYE